MDPLKISIPRGDIRPIEFNVYNSNGELSDIEFTDIYFTVKANYRDKKYLIQKRLSNGTIESVSQGVYKFFINASDTDCLQYGDYVFDIEVILGDEIKETTVGILSVTYEVTFAANEVT